MASKQSPDSSGGGACRWILPASLVSVFGVLAVGNVASALATGNTANGPTTVNVVAGKPSEFRFTLSTRSVKQGTVTFKLTNKGALPHDLKLCSRSTGGDANSCAGKTSTTISPGGSTNLKVTFATKGTYEYLCTVPGHAAAGMKGDIKVA